MHRRHLFEDSPSALTGDSLVLALSDSSELWRLT